MRHRIWIVGLVVLAAAQLVPVSRTNPPVETEIPAPADVREILRTSCYDCHSNESRWPWYAHVAPMSWLVAYDVKHARKHLNFSTWNAYDAKKRRKKMEELWEEVEGGEMPLWFYVPLHPEAHLDASELRSLRAWAQAPTP